MTLRYSALPRDSARCSGSQSCLHDAYNLAERLSDFVLVAKQGLDAGDEHRHDGAAYDLCQGITD